MMKKISLLILSIYTTINVFSQSPEMINYQAVVRDGYGNVINGNTNGSVGIQLTVLKGSSTGTEAYKETFSIAPNTYGLVNLKIGTGTVGSGTFSSIDWGIDSYWIKTEYDLNGGTNYTIFGTSQFLSVPYALYANSAGGSGGLPTTGTTNDVLTWDGSAWVAQTNDGYEANTDNQNAAQVNYTNTSSGLTATTVQAAIDEVSSNSELPSTGTTNDVLTWDGSAWVAQANDGYEADTDDQNLSEVLSEGNAASDGQQINIDQIMARDGDGLALNEDGGLGIFIEDGGFVGIGDNNPDNKLDVEFGTITTGDQVVGRTNFLYGSGNGTANVTSFQGSARTNSWSGTANLIGLHGFAENVANGAAVNTPSISITGVRGEAIGQIHGTSSSVGGFFTASGSDVNFALQTDLGTIRFGDLSGTGDRMVITGPNGDLSTQDLPSDNQNLTGASLSGTTLQIDIEDGSPVSVDLSDLQDGTGTDNQTASEVSYSNASSGLSASTVQSAIDEINTNNVNLWERDAANGEIYPLNLNDKIGIGTDDPATELDVNGQISSKAIHLSSNSDNSTGLSVIKSNNGSGQSQTGISVSILGGQNENSLTGYSSSVTNCQNCTTQDVTNLYLTTNSSGKSYGIYSLNESRDHFDGSVSIGSSLKNADFFNSTGLVVNGDVGIGLTNDPSAKLHVNGNTKIENGYFDADKPRLGWNGYAQKIIIRPCDIIVQNESSTFSNLSYNGGSIRVNNGADAYVNVVIPPGYYCSGYHIYLDNEMDDFEIYANDIQNTNGTQIGTTLNVSAVTEFFDNFSQTTNLEGGDENWLTFKFINDGSNQFIFNGMKVWITKCTSGCGL